MMMRDPGLLEKTNYSLWGAPSKLVTSIKERCHEAIRQRQKVESDWAENVRMLNGEWYDLPDFGMDRVTVNTFWRIVRSMGPSLYMKDPDILVNPKRAQDVDSAPVMEAAINYWIKRMKTKEVMHSLIPDALTCSFGVAKTGYVLENVSAQVKVDPQTGDMDFVDDTTQIDLAEHTIEVRQFMLGSHPVVNRTSPFNFYMDWKGTGLHNAEWCFERILRNIDEVKADKAYKNTKGLQPMVRYARDGAWQHQYYQAQVNDLFSGSRPGDQKAEGRALNDLTELWEFWHRPTRMLYVVSPTCDKILREDPWPYEHDSYPFHTLFLTVRGPDKLYPMPFLSAVKPQAIELNKIRSYILAFVKRASTRFFIDISRCDDETIQAMKAGKVCGMVPTDGDPNEIVKVLEGASMGPEVPRWESSLRQEIREVTGTTDFESQQSDTTATSQKLVEMSKGITIEWMQDCTLDTLSSIAEATGQNMKQFADLPQMVKVTGRSDFQWREYTRDDIQGEYDMEVKAGTQLHIDRNVQKKQSLDMMNILLPIGLQTGKVNVDQLLIDTLEKFPDVIRDPHKILVQQEDPNTPPQDPMAENILLSVGGMPKVGPNDPHQLHLQVHGQQLQKAKTQEEAFRILAHIRGHEQAEMQQRMMAMQQAAMQLQSQAQQGPPGPGGPNQQAGPGPGGPSGPPGLQGGQGRAAPQPGHPIAPRLFNERPPTDTQMMRVQGRAGGP